MKRQDSVSAGNNIIYTASKAVELGGYSVVSEAGAGL